MKIITILTMILLGGVWIFYTSVDPIGYKTRATSHAMAFEFKLKTWAAEKVSEGKLTQADVQELFPENKTLQLGGESPNQNFREMMKQVAKPNNPPKWPGAALIVIGLLATFTLPSKPKSS